MKNKFLIASCETIQNGGGIYEYDVNTKSINKILPINKPMYMVKDENLYILERDSAKDNSSVLSIYKDNKLEKKYSTLGNCACHLTKNVNDIFVTNYLSSSVFKTPNKLVVHNGKSINELRQEKPHTHCVINSNDGNLFVADLGTDSIYVYNINLELLSVAKVQSGYGVRHLVFNESNNILYAINELIPSISVFEYKNNELNHLKTISIGVSGNTASGSAIRLSKDRKYLYVSIRGDNKIISFLLENNIPKYLDETASYGDSPRDFILSNDEKYIVITNESGEVVTIEINNGKFQNKVGLISLPHPICVINKENYV